MQVMETATEGLKREFRITIPKGDLDGRLTAKLDEIKGQVQLKGFRPGKVPVAHLRKTFGKSLMGEIIQEAVNEGSQSAIEERSLRPAQQPHIELEGEIEQVLTGKEDLSFKVALEIMPDFTPVDPATLTIERLTSEVTDAEVDEALNRLAEQQKTYSPRAEGEAVEGDRLTIDFVGKVDGEAFEGGSAEGAQIVIGSKRFIPGFEEQLVGVKAGDARDLNVTFPADYGAQNLAGKVAVFETQVKEVAKPDDVAIDDALATKLGLESLDQLKERVRDQIKQDFAGASRAHLKRALLDQLDKAHSFDLPPGMVEAEFNGVWSAVEAEMKREDKTFPVDGKSEDETRAEYRAIAERRVRLGLVLAEIGRLNNLTIGQEELTRAIAQRARQFPGQERQVFEFYQKNPAALAEVRAPLFEDKVVDFIVELATVNETTVPREELFSDPDDRIEREKAKA